MPMTPPDTRYRIEIDGRSDWRRYQDHLKRGARSQKRRNRLMMALACALLLLFAGHYLIGSLLDWRYGNETQTATTLPEAGKSPNAPHQHFTKESIRRLISGHPLVNYRYRSFEVVRGDQHFLVDTTLRPSLQTYLTDHLRTATARFIAIVVIDPESGRVLAMSGFNKLDRNRNPCLESDFPAASVIKIITASAALEKGGLSPDSTVSFNGGRHTLYKSQLKTRKNRYSNITTLGRSFAESINPVFGKIGVHVVGDDTLQQYALRFGFNQPISFELPVGVSKMGPAGDDYHLAELASGFNRQTRISPVHGAMLAAAVVNGGVLLAPSIIDQVWSENGRVVYHGEKQAMGRAVSDKGARYLRQMMQTTINTGTCSKAFRGYRRDRILSKLVIGGKSGSIDNIDHDARYDWFVGFARQKSGDGAIAVSVMVAHEKYLGMRAAEYARLAIRRFFREKRKVASSIPAGTANRS